MAPLSRIIGGNINNASDLSLATLIMFLVRVHCRQNKKRNRVYHWHLKLTLLEACHVAEKSEGGLWGKQELQQSPVNNVITYVLWVWILTTCERPLGLEISRVLGPILLLASLATRLWPRLPNNHFLFSLSFSQSRFHSPFTPVVLTSRAHALNLGKNTVCFVVYLWPLNFYNSREERSLASLNSEDDT